MTFKLQLLYRAASASVAKVAAEFFGRESLEMAILDNESLDTPNMGRHLRFGRENRVGALWPRKFGNAKLQSRTSGHVKSLLRKSTHQPGISTRVMQAAVTPVFIVVLTSLVPLAILKPVRKVWFLSARVFGFWQQWVHWSSKF